MFDFLKKGRAARKSSQKSIEVLSLDRWTIHFRSDAAWALRETLMLTLRRARTEPSQTAQIEVFVTEAKVLEGDYNEYHGQVLHAPTEVASWFSNAPSEKAPPPRESGVVVSELRRGRRAVRSFQVVSKDLQRFKALCGDISHSGMRLIADERLEIGRELELDLDFDDFRFPKVRFRSEVMWCQQRDETTYWVGMRFMDVQDQERKLIETYIGLVDRAQRQMRVQ